MYGSRNPFAVDMSKVCVVSRTGDGAAIVFDMGPQRGATLVIDRTVAEEILQSLPDAVARVNHPPLC